MNFNINDTFCTSAGCYIRVLRLINCNDVEVEMFNLSDLHTPPQIVVLPMLIVIYNFSRCSIFDYTERYRMLQFYQYATQISTADAEFL